MVRWPSAEPRPALLNPKHPTGTIAKRRKFVKQIVLQTARPVPRSGQEPHRRRKGRVEAENLAAPDGERTAVLEIHRPFIRASLASGLMERLVGRWEKRQGQENAVGLYSNEALTLQLVLHTAKGFVA